MPQTHGLNFPPELVVRVVVGQQLLEKFIGGGVQGGGEELHVMLVEEWEDQALQTQHHNSLKKQH